MSRHKPHLSNRDVSGRMLIVFLCALGVMGFAYYKGKTTQIPALVETLKPDNLIKASATMNSNQ